MRKSRLPGATQSHDHCPSSLEVKASWAQLEAGAPSKALGHGRGALMAVSGHQLLQGPCVEPCSGLFEACH